MPVSSSGNASGEPRPDPAHARDSSGRRFRVSSPLSLLAVIPFLLHFEPAEHDLVVLGTAPPNSQVALALRYDLPGPRRSVRLARSAAGILLANGVQAAYAAGYGPDDSVVPVARALRTELAAAGIPVTEFLRAQDGRYWSYICADPDCCPPEGTPFDLKDHPVTRQHADQAVLASRQALAATLAPAAGQEAEAMHRATSAAQLRWRRLAASAARGTAPRSATLEPRLSAVHAAIGLYRSGGNLGSHEDAAWLALSLTDTSIRDDAWSRMDREHRDAHRRLWTDLTRLARPGYVAAPASLLAFTAWQAGDGALGNVALDRALTDNPRYSMALLLRDALDAGVPPSMACLPMTPEQAAAAYDELEAAGNAPEAQ